MTCAGTGALIGAIPFRSDKRRTSRDTLTAMGVGAALGFVGGVVLLWFQQNQNKQLPPPDHLIYPDGFDPYNVKLGEGMVFSEDFAKAVARETFGELPWVRNIYVNKDNPALNLTMINGCLIHKNRTFINGDTIRIGNGEESDVYLSRTAFTSLKQLKVTIGHEFIHCTQNYMYSSGFFKEGEFNEYYSNNFPLAELAAYNWEAHVGMNTDYLPFDNVLKKFDWRNKHYYNWLLNAKL